MENKDYFKHFIPVPYGKEYEDLTLLERSLYGYLVMAINNFQRCEYSNSYLAKVLGVGDKTIVRAKDKLREKGFITWKTEPALDKNGNVMGRQMTTSKFSILKGLGQNDTTSMVKMTQPVGSKWPNQLGQNDTTSRVKMTQPVGSKWPNQLGQNDAEIINNNKEKNKTKEVSIVYSTKEDVEGDGKLKEIFPSRPLNEETDKYRVDITSTMSKEEIQQALDEIQEYRNNGKPLPYIPTLSDEVNKWYLASGVELLNQYRNGMEAWERQLKSQLNVAQSR